MLLGYTPTGYYFNYYNMKMHLKPDYIVLRNIYLCSTYPQNRVLGIST
jgi:hypothetical protein